MVRAPASISTGEVGWVSTEGKANDTEVVVVNKMGEGRDSDRRRFILAKSTKRLTVPERNFVEEDTARLPFSSLGLCGLSCRFWGLTSRLDNG